MSCFMRNGIYGIYANTKRSFHIFLYYQTTTQFFSAVNSHDHDHVYVYIYIYMFYAELNSATLLHQNLPFIINTHTQVYYATTP